MLAGIDRVLCFERINSLFPALPAENHAFYYNDNVRCNFQFYTFFFTVTTY